MRPVSFAPLLAGALCLAAGFAAAAGPGTTAANFLKIPVGARETALGGALTAAAAGPAALFYNPAGLGSLTAAEVSYSYNNYFSGLSQQWLAAALPLGPGGLGLGLNYFAVKSFAAYDASGAGIGSVSAYDAAAYLGYGAGLRTGLALLPDIRIGAAVKYLRGRLDDATASGYGADAGVALLPALRGLSLGLGVENLLGSRMEYIDSGARPARKLKAGAAYLVRGLPITALLTADFNFPEDGASYLSAGIENTLYGALALRAGYTAAGDVSNGITFGLGLALPRRYAGDLSLDYSYGATYDLGNVHKFGLSYKFAPPAAKKAGAPASQAAVAAVLAVATAPAAAPDFNLSLEDLYGADPAAALAAAEAIANEPRAMEHFSALLSSGKTEWRQTAVAGLARSSDPRAPAELIKALGDSEPEVRAAAARALDGRGGAAAAERLQELLRQEEDETVKNAFIQALGKAGGL
ncbi:MAG: PorV/PorQ family protein [Elusimicrobiales bacterium]